jgi:preprotein translocase subunit YajC
MPVVLIFIVFYFLLIRPQKKAQDEHKKMVEGLKKNDEVITAGGIHGTIMNVKESTVTLKVDDNVKIEVQKSSVMTMKRKASA